MVSQGSQPHPAPVIAHSPPSKANLKAWWNHFSFVQKTKKEAFEVAPYRALDTADHPVFGKPLKESLRYASVQISTADANGDLYVWGYIPVVVAKCGLYLKENATEVPGTFRVNGSNKRMRDLQAAFESPPRYGKNLDWKNETYTTHDVASVFRRYLTQMQEPVIPYDMYHLFRDALDKQPFNQEEVITTFKALIRRMPRANQYLLLYVLDLLSVFARKSDKNLMTATNLAVIFRPGIISHPKDEMSPHAHALSQKVLEFLIAQQDWFMLDIVPPPPPGGFPGDDDDDVGAGQGGSAGGGAGGSGAGPSRGAGAPGAGAPGGGAGRWREGSSTPTRQGTVDSTWLANAEAGPSTLRTTTRQRVISGSPDVGAWQSQNRGSGSTSGHGHGRASPNSPVSPKPSRNNSYPYPQSPPISPTPKPQHIRRTSLQVDLSSSNSHSNTANNANSNPHGSQRRQANQHAHENLVVPKVVSDNSGDSGSVFATPMSSMPPSPNGHESDQRQGHYFGQQQQQPPQSQPSHPTLTRRITQPEPPTSYHPGPNININAHGATPIHSKYLHTDPMQTPQLSSTLQSQSSHSSQLVPTPTHSYPHPQRMQSTDSSPSTQQLQQHQYVRSVLPYGFTQEWAAPLGSGASDVDDVMVIPPEEEESYVDGDTWKLVPKGYPPAPIGTNGTGGGGFLALGGKRDKERERVKERERAREKEEKERMKAMRRRTTMDRSELIFTSNGQDTRHPSNGMLPIQESSSSSTANETVVYGVVRSRTLPSRRKGGDLTFDDKENANTGLGDNSELANSYSNLNGKTREKERGEKRVLKKQRRVSSANRV